MQPPDPTTSGIRDDAQATSDELLRQTNKRLTLNLLIQGAAAHSFLTAHHLVSDELDAIRPGLTRLYDQWAIASHLSYWLGDLLILFGPPSWFWRRTHRPGHPFHRHRLLAVHGGELSRASKRYLQSRGWKKWVIGIPVFHYFQTILLYARVQWSERGREAQLEPLAKRAASLIWGIDEDRLVAVLTWNVAFGHLHPPKTAVGRFLRSAVVGYGGVERRDGQFKVVARARNWCLVIKELVKGAAELICLHGLNTLDDETYQQVTEEADQIEYEIWMLQAGAEMWRRLLAALPDDRSLAEMMMHIARLDPEALERLMMAVVEDTPQARQLLDTLGR